MGCAMLIAFSRVLLVDQVLDLARLGFAEDHSGWHQEMLGIYTQVRRFLSLRGLQLTKNLIGENTFMSWAKIVDCGDVRMTPLDNTVALKQLDKAHQVCNL
jgi:hypothetical protein